MITESHEDNLTVSEHLKSMSFKAKVSYLWDYYKWIVIGAMCFVIVGAILVTNLYRASHTNSILEVTLINANALEADQKELFSGFLDTLDDLEGDETVTVDASLSIDLDKQDAVSAAAFQVLSAKLLSGGTDILICDEKLFLKEQENNAFLPLDEVLKADDTYDKEDAVVISGKAYGIRVLDPELLDGSIYPENSALVMGVASTSRDPEIAGEFINWFLLKGVKK